MQIHIQMTEEPNGFWEARIPSLGVAVYGKTREEASRRAAALALRVLSEQTERGERPVDTLEVTFAVD